MEGKVVIMMSALLVVVLGQVEAQTVTCCPSNSARNMYTMCRIGGGSRPMCASLSGCRRLNGNCPAGWTFDMLQNTAPAAGFTSCCPNATARAYFERCRLTSAACAQNSGCFLLRGMTTCPAGWTYKFLQNTNTAGDNAVANEYCKSGCVSSVCAVITTLQDSDASEVVNGAVEKCTKACSDFCTNKGSVIATAVETA